MGVVQVVPAHLVDADREHRFQARVHALGISPASSSLLMKKVAVWPR
jgi:hypothetical protein